MECKVFFLLLRLFPGHLSRSPPWIIFFNHNKCIPLRYASSGPSLKFSSHSCDVLIGQLPCIFPLFPACIFFFLQHSWHLKYDLFIFCLYPAEDITALVLGSDALPSNSLFVYPFPWFKPKHTCLSVGKRKAHLPSLHPLLSPRLSPMGNGNPPL